MEAVDSIRAAAAVAHHSGAVMEVVVGAEEEAPVPLTSASAS